MLDSKQAGRRREGADAAGGDIRCVTEGGGARKGGEEEGQEGRSNGRGRGVRGVLQDVGRKDQEMAVVVVLYKVKTNENKGKHRTSN